jgi:hypothetical protein
MTELASYIWGDYNTDRIPSSGFKEPKKRLIREWGTWIEGALLGTSVVGRVIHATRASLYADLAHAANTMAWVWNDPTTAYNGIYAKVGASGSGSWTRLTDLPYSFLAAQNDGDGTANAIEATTPSPIPDGNGRTLITLPIFATNTNTPVTVEFNEDGSPLTIKTSAGNDPVPGGLVAGMIVAGWKDGSTFRMLSDQASAAIQAAAEDAADRAEAAAVGIAITTCATRTELKALDPSLRKLAVLREAGREGTWVWRTGDYSAQIAADTAEGLYLKADSVAASAGAWVRVYDGSVLPTWFGATANAGSSQHTALQAWIDSGAEDLYLPPGIWRADSTLTCGHNVKLHGPGVLDFGYGTGQLLVTGAGLSALDPLSANVSRGGRALSWSSSQGLAARDIVVLYNPTDYSWGSRRTYYRDGAAFRVHSMSGNTANIYGQAVDPYVAASFACYKMSTVRATIDIGGFVAAGSGSVPPLYLKWCADSRVNRLRGHGGLYTICEIDQCFGVTVDLAAPINASPAAGDEYGVIVSNSTHVHFDGDASMATRHAIALGGRDNAGAIPCRYITVSGVTLCNGADGDDVGAADAHGNCDFVTYDNCTMLSGATVGGRNGALRNCTIFGMDSAHGDCINSAEFVGSGTFTLENCTLISEGNGASVGYINIVPLGPSGAGSPAQTSMRGDLNVVIRNLTVRTPNAISTSKLLTLRPANADYKTNLTMDGVVWIAPAGLAFVYAEDTTLSAMLSDGLSVDNVQGPSGTYLIYPTSDIAAVPTREMRQCGRASVTTAAATSVIASPVSYRYPYSRAPSGQCAISLTDGSASSQTAGQNAIPKLYAISNTQIRPAMLASANFTASVAVDLHWSAEVRGF